MKNYLKSFIIFIIFILNISFSVFAVDLSSNAYQSPYTITWQNGSYVLNLHYVDLDENILYSSGETVVVDTIEGDGNTPMSNYSDLVDVDEYIYRYAYVYDNGVKTPVNYLSCNVTKGSWFYTTSMTRNDWVTWSNMNTETVKTADVYLVYSKPILNEIHNNIKITLFDYGSYINSGSDKVLKFLKTLDNHTQIDGAGVGSVTATSNPPEMKNVLVNGYPALSNGKSLKYLFHQDGSDFIKGAGTMTSYDTMRSSATWTAANGYTTYYESMRFSLGNDGGLFELDENGYFRYSCANNAAYFNGTRFELYDNLISPGHKKGDMSGNNGWNFYPFDNPIPSTKNSIGIHPENGKEVYFTGYSAEEDSAGTITYYNEKNTVANMWYGMYMTFDLYTPRDGKINGEDMIFEFKGDDDVWVYLDDVLVLNIGGTHGAQEGKINFSTGEVSDPQSTGTIKSRFEDAGKDTSDFDGDTFNSYTPHTLRFYYLERGGNIGYCSLIFNTPTLPDESLMVSKEVESNSEDSQIIEETLEYGYRVLAVEDGVLTDDLFIKSGETFDIMEYDTVVDTGVVDENGYFYLKSGQTAIFNEMLEKGSGYLSYVVEEVLPNDLKGQYGNIKYTVSGDGGVFIPDDESSDGVVSEVFTEYRTPILEADESNIIKYTNIVDIVHLSSLSITKNADILMEQYSPFEVQVKLGNELLPIGTEYIKNGVTYMVETEGIILLNNNETAIIDGIISGTEFEIVELNASLTKPSYTGTISDSTGVRDIGNLGEFTLGSSVNLIITNDFDGVMADTLPDMGGKNLIYFDIVGYLFVFIGIFILYKIRR